MVQKQSTPSANAGANLKHLIKDAKLTQEDFAEKFCAEPRTVRRWIKCGIKDINTIYEIARFFDVDVMTILS